MTTTLLGVVIVAVTLTKACAPDNLMKQRQAVVDLCEVRGGIPILNDAGDNIVRCDFPPMVGPPQVERK